MHRQGEREIYLKESAHVMMEAGRAGRLSADPGRAGTAFKAEGRLLAGHPLYLDRVSHLVRLGLHLTG